MNLRKILVKELKKQAEDFRVYDKLSGKLIDNAEVLGKALEAQGAVKALDWAIKELDKKESPEGSDDNWGTRHPLYS